ncbi:MAG: hypothetical protein AAF622_06790 [Cyanobacteria bacterium P01_C01_bin.147]
MEFRHDRSGANPQHLGRIADATTIYRQFTDWRFHLWNIPTVDVVKDKGRPSTVSATAAIALFTCATFAILNHICLGAVGATDRS